MISAGARFDVIVVGAGLAGHVAALTAAEAVGSVLLLEKGPQYGGSSVRAGGGLLFAGTDRQRAAGIEDSDDALREDLLRTGRGKARPELVDAYVDNQLETYEWLRARGVNMALATENVPGEVVRIHLTGQGLATHTLHDRIDATPAVTYQPNAEVRRLGRVGGVGRVEQVEVVVDGVELTLYADRAVVLTAGGFARSAELLDAFAPQWTNAVKMSGRYNTGDGIRMAWALGAGLADMPYVAASFGASIARYPKLDLDPDEEPILLYPNFRGAVIVNLEGRRFGNEELNYKVFAGLCAQQPGGVAVQIFDEAIFQQSDELSVPTNYKAALAAGLVKRADTITELAEVLNLDLVTTQATIDRYNDGVRAGEDTDFGRPFKHRDNPGGGLIERAPFYGFPTRPGLTSTFAGLTVDATMRVLDVFGAPIDGLYAAGETVGGFHGAGYYSATGLGKAAIFGRVAGRSAAAS